MNKRSAMVLAAGLVAALLAGGAALSFSLTGGTAVAQDAGRVKPIVKTEHRTVTIHKKAKSKPAEVVTISAPSGSSVSSSTSSDDGYESESSSEDSHESEQEDDAFEQESSDHSGESGGDD
jgi:hypothetical protein